MKILILGSTGRTGKWLVSSALEKGYEVNCLVRDRTSFKAEAEVTLFEGSPVDKNALKDAMIGCECVVSALNISRTSDFPWARLRTPESFLSDVMKNVISVAGELGVKRVITCSAWGVAETREHIPGWFRWFIDHSNIGVTYKDHEVQESLLEGSDLEWTIVRPVGLSNSKKDREVVVSYDNRPKPGLMISRKSVAEFMIGAIENKELLFKKPVISQGKTIR